MWHLYIIQDKTMILYIIGVAICLNSVIRYICVHSEVTSNRSQHGTCLPCTQGAHRLGDVGVKPTGETKNGPPRRSEHWSDEWIVQMEGMNGWDT